VDIGYKEMQTAEGELHKVVQREFKHPAAKEWLLVFTSILR
jgi:hypothetical protein